MSCMNNAQILKMANWKDIKTLAVFTIKFVHMNLPPQNFKMCTVKFLRLFKEPVIIIGFISIFNKYFYK